MADELTNLIPIEDIQDLVIVKKFVKINSNKYTPEALEYIKHLIDEERAILWDGDTHRIWTLGDYYGGDVFKEDLKYYSKIKSIDGLDELIEELEALGPEQELAYKGKNHVTINLRRDDENHHDVVEIGLDLYNLINSSINKYSLFINDDGKIDIKEYIAPKFLIEKQEYDPNNQDIELPFEIESTIPIEEWKKFNITVENCDLISIENDRLRILIDPSNYESDIEEKIIFDYDDGHTKGKFIVNGIFNIYCYYGCYDESDFNYIDTGSYIIENGSIENVFELNQYDRYFAFFRCPFGYSPILVDDIRKSQGAWHREYDVVINNKAYQTYVSDNSGLGNIRWKVIENIE